MTTHDKYNIGICIVTFILAVVGFLLNINWLIGSSLTVIVACLGVILTNLYWFPKSYNKIRIKVAKADVVAQKHPILAKYFSDGISNTEKELESIIRGRFNFQVTEVPEMSNYAMSIVDKKCILIFPVKNSENLLTPITGSSKQYYDSMIVASNKMHKNTTKGVVRVFVINRNKDISNRLLNFIKKNLDDNIDVRLIFEDELPTIPQEIEELDFGYYENEDGHKWVMILKQFENNDVIKTDYIVETDLNKIQHYERYSEDIIRKSKTFEDFINEVSIPMNGDLWPVYFAERGYEMHPPHGLSDEDADYIVDSALKSVSDTKEFSILVLGYTPKIFRRLIDKKVTSITSIDIGKSKPLDFQNNVKYVTSNWLNINLEEKFDVILFDEAINNLTRLQVNLFFQNIKKVLKPKGHLIGRVMGCFEEQITQNYINKTQWDCIEDLRKIKGDSHIDYASLIICLLHSKHISYSTETFIVDCSKWNLMLDLLRKNDKITQNEYRNWKLQFSFKLLSPSLSLLLNESKEAQFSPSEIRLVDGTYIEKWGETLDFYRIINLEYIPI